MAEIKRIFEAQNRDLFYLEAEIFIENGQPKLLLSHNGSTGETYNVTDVENDVLGHIENYLFDNLVQ